MKSTLLPVAYRRTLSAVVRNIENALHDIEMRVVINHNITGTLHRVEKTISDKQREQIAQAIVEFQTALHRFIEKFQLKFVTVSESQILNAHIAHIWTLLEDSRSLKMKAYGEIEEHAKRVLDSAIDELNRSFEQLRKICSEDN